MKQIFHYLKSYAFLAVISPLMMMGEVAADLCLPFFMSFIVNYGIVGIDIYSPEKGSRFAAAIVKLFCGAGFGRMDIIVTFGIMMLVITLTGGFFGTFSAYTSAKAAQGMGYDLRRDAYRKVMSLSIEQTDDFTTGSLVTRMTNDISMVVEFVEFLLKGMVRSPMFLVGGTIMLLLLDVKFGLLILSIIPVLVLVLGLVLGKAVPMYSVVQKRLDKVNSVVQENVSGARVVKAYNREAYECGRFDSANSQLRTVNYDVLKLMAVISPVLTVLLNLSIIAIIYVGGFSIGIENAGMSTGSIMAAITYATLIINGLMMMTNLFQMVSRAAASSKRVNEILETAPAIESGSRLVPESGMEIAFQDVSFRYPHTAGMPVLNHINLEIRRGETLAVIGATGSGKSSLAALIPRFYDATGGQVLINGIPIREYSLPSLRSKIGYVMQKSELFSDTIAQNIRWGKKYASEEEVKQAAGTAQASGFIQDYDSHIEEKGASLSGGQKQRLSLARALVRRPEILILDDSTSALDLSTEARLRNALKHTLKNTTVIIIAQRIASVQDADRIAVMENNGTILHCAPHEELLAISETYRNIYFSQVKSGAYKDAGLKGAM